MWLVRLMGVGLSVVAPVVDLQVVGIGQREVTVDRDGCGESLLAVGAGVVSSSTPRSRVSIGLAVQTYLFEALVPPWSGWRRC